MAESAQVYYEGPVCYYDGWHYTVETDEADKARRVAIAEAELKHAKTKGDEGVIAAAQANLNEVLAHPHHAPGQRLHLEDNEDGSLSRYRLATDADTRSWHDRKHRTFATVEFEDGQPGLRVTAEDLEAIKQFLDERRGQ